MTQTQESIDTFYDQSPRNPIPSDVRAVEIRPAPGPFDLPEEKPGPARVFRAFGGPANHARCAARLDGRDDWIVRWKANLDPKTDPRHVFAHAGTVVVFGPERFEAFNAEGRPVASQTHRRGDVIIDAAHGRLLHTNPLGFIVARRLDDGRQVFYMLGRYGDAFGRDLMLTRGSKLVLASTQLPFDAFGDRQPELSMVEVHELGDPVQTDEEGLVTSATCLANVLYKSAVMLAAAQDELIALAYEDRVFLLDEALKVKHALAGAFRPLSLSLDAAGRVYMIVRTRSEEGAAARPVVALWAVAPDGQRFIDVELPEDVAGGPAVDFDAPSDAPQARVAPPVVGYDHRVFVCGAGTIIAIEPGARGAATAGEGGAGAPGAGRSETQPGRWGRIAWRRTVGPVAGATITADGRLLVTAGTELTALDAEGRSNVLFRCDEPLCTGPFLTDGRDMFVASRVRLYCLSSRR